MSRALLAAFSSPDAIKTAARAAHARGAPALDAFTPFPMGDLADPLNLPRPKVGWVMLAAGAATFAAVYGMELWSVFRGYPFNSGGRPLNSWPAFVIAPTEFAILFAALGGFAALLVMCGLPRLHHPLFDRPAFERASQDQFVLALPLGAESRALAFEHGAVWVEEAEL